MGIWLANVQWGEELRPDKSPEEQDQLFRSILTDKMQEIFPEKV